MSAFDPKRTWGTPPRRVTQETVSSRLSDILLGPGVAFTTEERAWSGEFIKIVSGLVGRLARRQGDRMKRRLPTNGSPAERNRV